jgi:hypothetical protein
MIKDGPGKTSDLFNVVKCGMIDYTGDTGFLDNINTPEDYSALKES